MQISDEMVEKATAAYMEATGAEQHQLDGWFDRAIRAALEAALSTVAEPVAYMHPMGAIWRLDNCPAGIEWDKDGWIPLYAAPAKQEDTPLQKKVAEELKPLRDAIENSTGKWKLP